MPELAYRDLFGTQIDVGDILLLGENLSAAKYGIVPYRVLGKGKRNSQEGPVPTLQLRLIELAPPTGEQFWPEVYREQAAIRRKTPITNWTFQRGVCLSYAEHGSSPAGDLVVLQAQHFNLYADKNQQWNSLLAAYEAAADPEPAGED